MSRWNLILGALEAEAESLPSPDFDGLTLDPAEHAFHLVAASVRNRWITKPPTSSTVNLEERAAFIEWLEKDCDDAIFARMMGSVAIAIESILLDAGRGVEGEARIEGTDEPYLELVVNQSPESESPLLSGGASNPVRIQSVVLAQSVASSVGIPQVWGALCWRWLVEELRHASAPGLLPGIGIDSSREDRDSLRARLIP